jgi:hypothetical protein
VTTLAVPRSALGRLVPLGTGGTARIHRTPDFSVPEAKDLVFKEYRKKILTSAGPALLPGLSGLVEFPTRLEDTPRRLWGERIIWPLRVVLDDGGAAVGIIMPLIAASFFEKLRLPSGDRPSRPREVELLFGSEADTAKLGLAAVQVMTRLLVCAQIARSYGLMHHAGVVVGDISGRNVLYDTRNPDRPTVLVLDTDSARLEGTRSVFGAQPHTPRWEPPEALAAGRQLALERRSGQSPDRRLHQLNHLSMVQSKETDVYKFGLLVVRMLDHGRNRTANRDPAVACQVLRGHLGRHAAALLERTLDGDPKARPSMREWYRTMGGHPPEPSRRPAPVLPGPAGPVVSGDWILVEGTGWVRRGATGPPG